MLGWQWTLKRSGTNHLPNKFSSVLSNFLCFFFDTVFKYPYWHWAYYYFQLNKRTKSWKDVILVDAMEFKLESKATFWENKIFIKRWDRKGKHVKTEITTENGTSFTVLFNACSFFHVHVHGTWSWRHWSVVFGLMQNESLIEISDHSSLNVKWIETELHKKW